jgi:hypothetical protein
MVTAVSWLKGRSVDGKSYLIVCLELLKITQS